MKRRSFLAWLGGGACAVALPKLPALADAARPITVPPLASGTLGTVHGMDVMEVGDLVTFSFGDGSEPRVFRVSRKVAGQQFLEERIPDPLPQGFTASGQFIVDTS